MRGMYHNIYILNNAVSLTIFSVQLHILYMQQTVWKNVFIQTL